MNNLLIKVLSLPDADVRRKKFSNTFIKNSSFSYEFFDGIYGKHLKKESIAQIYSSEKANNKINRDLTLGEIGATYSHYLMYLEANSKKVDYLLVLEDDTFINQDFDKVIKKITTRISPEEDAIIFIQEHTLNKKVIFSRKIQKLTNNYGMRRLLGSSQYFVGSYGYIVTKEAINKLILNYLPIFCVCDHWYFIKKQSGIKNFYCVIPSVVKTNEEQVRMIDSFINHDRQKIIKKNKISTIAKAKILVKKIVLTITDKDWE
ncbi:glycosyltransferase family 25 protein [Xenorhabdus thailandensis]|uniref:glycosyltransferase family 25 protein n=1 Tax=Xenorhabdus thailandensis TaxID=3136255 RepID=UPI0030F3EDC6